MIVSMLLPIIVVIGAVISGISVICTNYINWIFLVVLAIESSIKTRKW